MTQCFDDDANLPDAALQVFVVPIRRPPQPTESTALIERPSFSDHDDDVDHDDSFANVPARDVDSDERANEQTDPERRLARKVADDAPTGRYELGSLDDFDDLQLPSAHVSEFDVSDLDGDVEGPGAPTAIMQLPPSMIAQRDDRLGQVDEIALRKWSAGPQGPKVTAPSNDDLAAHDDGGEMAATLPALSLAAVRAAAAAAGVDAWPEPHLADNAPSLPMPLPPPPPPPPPALARPPSSPPMQAAPRRLAVTAADVAAKTRGSMLRIALDDALAAVTAAQACADAGHVPPGLHSHLDRAVELLSHAIDIAEDD